MKKVKLPTYSRDLTGSIERFDERDIVFARQDLFRYFGLNSQQFSKYYRDHPEHLDFDRRISQRKPLGADNPLDAAMFATQFSFLDELGLESMVDGEPANQKQKLEPQAASCKIKAVARLYGADLTKIGPLKQEWTYSSVGCTIGNCEGYPIWGSPIDLSHHTHAIGMGFRMDLDLLACAPFFPTLLATAQAYALSAWVSVRLAGYIRMLGYSARAHHFSNYQLLAVPVAVDCGLGELSRAGYLLTREFGLAVRLSFVTTDMPLEHDLPVDIGVQSFCEQCRICAEACPSGAIPSGGKIVHNGMKKWKLDEEKCYSYWHVNGTDCGICMAVCPWTKPPTPFHRYTAKLASIKGPHQGWLVRAERAVYGKHKPAHFPEYLENH
ncbi:MAG: 4Fe-4S dicluster domain-containing protein [Chloroflexi bacterium]|nr:4Fe-4S dicluster domain-containing protein [Chloroflexota bacterium]